MTDLLDLIGFFITVITNLLLLLIVWAIIRFLLRRKIAGDRAWRIRSSKMLLAELDMLSKIMDRYSSSEDADEKGICIEKSTEIIPHKSYDGLANSGNIAYLDSSLQEKIHTFYRLVAIHNRNVERGSVDSTDAVNDAGERLWLKLELHKLIMEVEGFYHKQKFKSPWLLKVFRLRDEYY